MQPSLTTGGNKAGSARWWPERLAAVLAIAGVILASLPGYHVATFQDAGSDFKTLYASSRCLLTGRRAYDFHNIGSVFTANGVVLPSSWYAHAPTYPPFTFALLAPIVSLPMVTAVYLWLFLSAAALVWLGWSAADFSDRQFGLSRPWRLLLIALIAASPLVSFGLQIGNVSVVASVLCIWAALSRKISHINWRAIALAVSLLLKPHIALWILVAMLLSHDREDRTLVFRTASFFIAVLLAFAAWFAVSLPFGLQLHDYARMVSSEIATGCLNPRNHELLPPAAEVTSLESLFGFFLKSPGMQAASAALLIGMASMLLYISRSVRHSSEEIRLELLGAWSTFGLLVTYHRTHDGIILFILLPWLILRFHRGPFSFVPWGVLALGVAMSLGSYPPSFAWIAKDLGFNWLSQFLVFRQSAIATAALMFLLIADLAAQHRSGVETQARRSWWGKTPAQPVQPNARPSSCDRPYLDEPHPST